jgi:hypothetical protein
MSIEVQCPVCAETLQAPDDAGGKGCPCPLCRAVVSVPLAERTSPPPGRVGACPTCTKSLTITPELEGALVTCPFCGVEFRIDAALVSRRRRRRFQCPHCGTNEPPTLITQISVAGWVIFAVFLVFFFPLFWVGLLITERVPYCYDCGRRANGGREQAARG